MFRFPERDRSCSFQSMEVVAAVIRKGDRFLLCQRPEHKNHGGLWEFPGGKVLPNESQRSAIKRELTEELGVVSSPSNKSTLLCVELDTQLILNISFIETDIHGEPQLLEHQQMGWFKLSEILELRLTPADAMYASDFLRAK